MWKSLTTFNLSFLNAKQITFKENYAGQIQIITANCFYFFTEQRFKVFNMCFCFYTESHLIFVTFLPGNIFNTPNIEIFSPGQKLRYFKSLPP